MEVSPSVSVIIPIYNVERYLDQCLQSVCGQTLASLEIICVNDGSTDGSADIIRRFAADDARVVVVSKENGGYGSAVNAGLDRAKGTYVGIVEPDDYLDLTMYEKLFSSARRNGFPDVVKGAYWRVLCNEDPVQVLPANYLHKLPEDEPFVLSDNAELLFHHPSVWSALYRRNFLLLNSIRMHEIPGAGWADNPWLIDTLVRAKSIVFVDECLYYYREFNAGATKVVGDPTILADRWIEMDDILRSLSITAPRIWEGHYNRACWHLKFLLEGYDQQDPVVTQCIRRIVHRMNYSFVCDCPRIPQDLKDLVHTQVAAPARLRHRLREMMRLHYRID